MMAEYCKRCRGFGFIGDVECNKCKGTGKLEEVG